MAKCPNCFCLYYGSYCKMCSEKPAKKKPKPIKKVSDRNTLQCTDGERISRRNCEANINLFKEQYRKEKILKQQYYCEVSGVTGVLDISHIVSVDDCYKCGKAEEAFNEENFELLSRKEHDKWQDEKVLNDKRTAYITKYFPELFFRYKFQKQD